MMKGDIGKIYFGSVIFNKNMKFLKNFLDSLEKQIYKNFELLLLNDDVKKKKLDNMISEFPKISKKTIVIETGGGLQPYELRILMLKEAKQRRGSLLILGDSDDMFAVNRIFNIVKAFQMNSDRIFFYNDFLLEHGKSLFGKLPPFTDSVMDIMEKNYLGLSNTAIAIGKITDNFIDSLYAGNLEVFDWYLYSRMLLNGYKGMYVEDSATIYRLHSGNYAGLREKSEENISKEKDIKVKHYQSLQKYSGIYRELYKSYTEGIDKENLNSNSEYYWWNFINIYRQ